MTTSYADITEETKQPTGSKGLVWALIVLLIVSLAAGGWFSWKKVFAGPSESAELDVGTIPDRFRPRGFVATPQPPPSVNRDGIHPIGASMFRVQNGEYFMTLAPTETSYAPLRLMIARRDVLTNDDRLLIRFCTDVANAAVAKSLDVTADQAKKLTVIRQQMNGGMKISDDDRNKLRELWKNWNAAKDAGAKSAAETTLLASMKDVGTRSMEPTKQQYVDLAGQIRKIITDQQIARYRQTRGG